MLVVPVMAAIGYALQRLLLNPTLGIQHVLRSWGFAAATFDWIVRPERAIYCLVIAGV